MFTRVIRVSIVCVMPVLLVTCQTEADGVAQNGDGQVAQAGDTAASHKDVSCSEVRRDTTVRSDTAGGTIDAGWVRFVYPKEAYNGHQQIHIRAHPTLHGVTVKPGPRVLSQLWLNSDLCSGDGRPYYFHIGNDYRPVLSGIDDVWAAGLVGTKDFPELPNEASLLPWLQVQQADTSSVGRPGFVILSN